MLYNRAMNKRIGIVLIVLGALSMLFGIYTHTVLTEDAHDLNRLMGMFTGFGMVMTLFGIFTLLQPKLFSTKKLKQQEIDYKDERNVTLRGKASTVTFLATTWMFAIMAFLFVGLGYRIPALFMMAALYMQLFIYLISYTVYSKKL
jgi:uncharacterized membrane protein